MKTKKHQKLNNKYFWKRGNGEILGFVCLIPCIFFIICFILSAAQVGTAEQKLLQTAYSCGRAASVSESEAIGNARAQTMYEQLIGEQDGATYIPCEIELLDGGRWEKGSYIKCTVRYHVDVLMPFTSGVREQSVIMMIEAGDLDI